VRSSTSAEYVADYQCGEFLVRKLIRDLRSKTLDGEARPPGWRSAFPIVLAVSLALGALLLAHWLQSGNLLGSALLLMSGVAATLIIQAPRRARGRAEGPAGAALAAYHTDAQRAIEREAQARVQAQAQLDQILRTVPGLVFSFQLFPDGRTSVLYASPAFVDLFGIAMEALHRDGEDAVYALMDSRDEARCRSLIVRSAATLTEVREEFRIRSGDGTRKWIDVRAMPERLADGSTRWSGVVSDVTARRETEDDLRTARETLTLLIEQSPVAIAMFDREMRYLAVSAQWARDFGDSAGALVGRSHYEVVPNIPEEWRRFHTEGLAGTSSSHEADPWTDSDGQLHWLRWALHPWRDARGTIGGIVIFCEDVTARVRTQRALTLSERRYRDLVEMSPDAIILRSGRSITFVNQAAIDLFRASGAHELVGRDMLTLMQSDDHRGVQEAGPTLRASRPLPGDTRRVRRLDGTTAEVRVDARRFTENGETKTVAILRDVTEEQQQARAIAEREARLAAVIDHAMDAIISIDDTQRIVMANAAAERIFQRPAATMIGEPLDVLIPARHREAHHGHVQHFTASGQAASNVHSVRSMIGVRADGSEFPAEATISRVDLGGGPLVTAIVRDVSERERMAAERLESEARFCELATSIRELFWLSNPARTSLDYVSPAFERIFGRPARLGVEGTRDWSAALHTSDRARFEAAYREVAGADACELEYRILRPDGAVRWLRDRASLVRNAQGEVVRLAGVTEDVTERRELEAQLRQTQKLESIGLLAGGVAHDFNNWLTVINANADLLRMSLGDDAEAMELASEIRNAGDRASSLTRELLAFSRQQVLEPRVVDVNAIVTDTEKMLRRLIGEDVVLRTALRASHHVLVDPGHLVQVLMNLAVNARDAMPTGGALAIETDEIDVLAGDPLTRQGASTGRHVRLTVHDSGSGMPAEVRHRIFEPFFTTKEAGRGTGLGLAVVHGIVRQSGGAIEVESEPGQGTTFRIVIPIVPERDKPDGVNREPQRAQRGERILLVEDEAMVRRVGALTLRSAGYLVQEADGGAGAIRILERDAGFDLLVTDVVMPGVGGGALLQWVREHRPSLPVLFTSGYTDDAVVRHGIIHAEVAFLQKPYNLHSLLAKVREALDRAPAPAGGAG